jgi:hypothetical protein
LFVTCVVWWMVLSLVTLAPMCGQAIPAAEYRERRAQLNKIAMEDTLLVPATGAEVLSSALPKEAGEIETLVGK